VFLLDVPLRFLGTVVDLMDLPQHLIYSKLGFILSRAIVSSIDFEKLYKSHHQPEPDDKDEQEARPKSPVRMLCNVKILLHLCPVVSAREQMKRRNIYRVHAMLSPSKGYYT